LRHLATPPPQGRQVLKLDRYDFHPSIGGTPVSPNWCPGPCLLVRPRFDCLWFWCTSQCWLRPKFYVVKPCLGRPVGVPTIYGLSGWTPALTHQNCGGERPRPNRFARSSLSGVAFSGSFPTVKRFSKDPHSLIIEGAVDALC